MGGLIIFLAIIAVIFVTIMTAGIGLSLFSWIGGYDDVYENAVEEQYERMDKAEADKHYQHFLNMFPEARGDTYVDVDVDARQVHIHNDNNRLQKEKQ